MYPASPVSTHFTQQTLNEIATTNETKVSKVALNALKVLSGMLVTIGCGCVVASLVVPAISCLVLGVALIIFLVSCADKALPCREEINPSNITSDPPSRNVSSTPDSSSEVTQTDPISLVDPYPELTQAREELLSWFDKEGSKLGQGDYDTLIEKINTLSQDLPKKKMTLHFDYFRFGFSLYYLEKTEEKKWMPLTNLERIILNWQTDKTPDACLPLKDPEDNSYFVPVITRNEVHGTHSGSEPVGSYLYRLVSDASYSGSSRHTLEGLTSYASQIKQEIGNDMYQALRQMIPSYPDL